MRTVLWWGRFDPAYSRNGILRRHFADLGWRVVDFRPRLSPLADIEAGMRRVPTPDLVWVPCFRQRDMAAASRWAARHRVPLVFDPLISAYDKQVEDRRKLAADSREAVRLLRREQALFARADRIIADTPAHADYFADTLGIPRERIDVILVGADATMFRPRGHAPDHARTTVEVLFFGSFIALQGPEVIVEAARLYDGADVRWTLIGNGPLRQSCEAAARGLANVVFEDWLPYEQLPDRIARADILLGVFGTTPKAGRVIPNKVFQSLAMGRPVITRRAPSYPDELHDDGRGIVWVEPGDAGDLARQIARLAADPAERERLGAAAARLSASLFSADAVRTQLAAALDRLDFAPDRCRNRRL